jgi:hypothetical protein
MIVDAKPWALPMAGMAWALARKIQLVRHSIQLAEK